MLEIRDMTIKAGNFLVSDVSFTVPEGLCHAIIGPTGSGKTLVLESVLGLRRPVRGTVMLDGADVTAVPIEKRGISYVPQDLALFPHLTVEDNINYSARINNRQGKGNHDNASHLADIVGIQGLLKRPVQHLSGGEKQRVALVRAIAAGNRCLVLDEPFCALHEGLKRELWFVLKSLQQEYGLTILMVSHDMEEAFFLADTISIMINGAIQQTGTRRAIYESPATGEVTHFLGIRNIFSGHVEEFTPEGITAFCPALNQALVLPASFGNGRNLKRGTPCTIGIRSEKLVIHKEGKDIEPGDNFLEGQVETVYMKGASHTIVLALAGKQNLEMEIADCSFQQFTPRPGQTLKILLRAKEFFLLDR